MSASQFRNHAQTLQRKVAVVEAREYSVIRDTDRFVSMYIIIDADHYFMTNHYEKSASQFRNHAQTLQRKVAVRST